MDWKAFPEHLKLMSKELYDDEKYVDVTLVSDDQFQFRAHKIILSACSPVFRNIIDFSPNQNSFIYLRGVESQELKPILQFMYLGEGKLPYERMGVFLKVAKDLQVKDINVNFDLESEEDHFDNKRETMRNITAEENTEYEPDQTFQNLVQSGGVKQGDYLAREEDRPANTQDQPRFVSENCDLKSSQTAKVASTCHLVILAA